ncbi:acyl-CoA dehydrogenase [Ramlibacter sp. RBP-2]|uniref:Acyl-CoA dehydrogenase n=1 Tax=Ramlibacter lithotrophicus TaxID=2606681 RepID=A0A7X6I8S3_9BURK|nr:acyl-CoA dehydrogenase family protein [Ramlibacter lithotrophicus]NKE68891.1 acyl-CoA dehydrogenase [Ramlibacter lithotrophicus]
MDFAFNEEQRLLRQAVEDLLAPMRPQPGDEDSGPNFEQIWRALTSAGLTGVLVPSNAGGVGLGLVEAGCILEGLGASLAGGSFISTAVLGAVLLGQATSRGVREEWLARIADGTLRLCVLPQEVATRSVAVIASAAAWTWPVIGFPEAHSFLFLRESPDGDGLLLGACERASSGWTAELLPWPDRSRQVHALQVPSEFELQASWPVPHAAASTLGHTAAAALSAEMLGGATRALSLACDYARERQQFGQPIGAFQSIKHLLADDRVLLDGLRSLTYAALWQLQVGDPAGPATAHAAKAWAGEVYPRIAADAIQVFGAMGVAAESLPHRYLKRAQSDRVVFGTPAWHLHALQVYEAAL